MIYKFGHFELDLATVELRAAGEVVSLEPQVLRCLRYLVENSERLVSRDEIIEKVWDGAHRLGCRRGEPGEVGAPGAR